MSQTFAATSELDPYSLVDILGQIKDCLALGLVQCGLWAPASA